MRRTYNFRSLETVIPPRCRKERFVEQDNQITVNIRELKESDVHPIFVVKEFDREPRRIVRYKGKNYMQMQDRRPDWHDNVVSETPLWVNQNINNMLEDWLEWVLGINYNYGRSAKEQIAKIKKTASEIIIVDGNLYDRCGEPYYSYITFGLGHNHGGTALRLLFAEPKEKCVNGIPADKRAEAIEYTINVAKRRGDDKFYELIRNAAEDIDVLAADAIRKRYQNSKN